ncbi:MAG TPA: hypothetical protein VFW65_31965 [Pseudonocardiaceae bacterium]|nr:hypothetical protein [Pseudonocardiaceae bacterium]
MGGTPNPGTPADQRLTENHGADSAPANETSGTGSNGGSDGNDQPYDTLMPWAAH